MWRVGGDRREQVRHALGRNQALQGEVSDKLLSRRQGDVDVARLVEKEHRIIKHGIGCRGRANGGSLLWGQARQESEMRHSRRGLRRLRLAHHDKLTANHPALTVENVGPFFTNDSHGLAPGVDDLMANGRVRVAGAHFNP